MPKYKVTISRQTFSGKSFIVEAESSEKAESKALKRSINSNLTWYSEEDEVTDVEEIKCQENQ